MAHVAYLCLGSNIGDRSANLHKAVMLLDPKVRVKALSSIYQTEPWGYSDQPTFLNQVTRIDTDLEPFELLEFVKEIECSLGRQETFRYGPRLIDLDILFYDDLILDTPQLTIPHPRIKERAFVLIPLAEIAPELLHPVFKKTVLELKTLLDPSNIVVYESPSS